MRRAPPSRPANSSTLEHSRNTCDRDLSGTSWKARLSRWRTCSRCRPPPWSLGVGAPVPEGLSLSTPAASSVRAPASHTFQRKLAGQAKAAAAYRRRQADNSTPRPPRDCEAFLASPLPSSDPPSVVTDVFLSLCCFSWFSAINSAKRSSICAASKCTFHTNSLEIDSRARAMASVVRRRVGFSPRLRVASASRMSIRSHSRNAPNHRGPYRGISAKPRSIICKAEVKCSFFSSRRKAS
mmetsp:Transcript_37510/g.49420  ORF Transcript_37510/g.49420 Transcript_37510/m.49420 type:complete len:239 (-) Transcript_37510:2395-3111(-)